MARDPRAAAREAADRTLQVLEDGVAEVVAEVLGEVAREFAGLIANPALPVPPAPPAGAELAAAGEPIDPDRLRALAHLWAAKLSRILGPLRRVYELSWAATARPFTPDAGPPTPALVDAYLTTATNRLTGVGDDLWARARQVLADGTLAGESTDQLAQRLQDAFAEDGTQLGTARAERIARTEVLGSWNRASRDSVGALPAGLRPRYKTWLATLDRRTRRDHWDTDGATVPLDGQFAVGGELLDYPGDPNGSPGQTVNCRCVPTYGDNPRAPADEGRQFLTAAEIDRLDRERPGRGAGPSPDVPLAASNLTTDLGAAGCRAGPTEPNHRGREMPTTTTQLDTVIATVLAGGRWTAAEVAAETGVPVPTVRTYLARGAELGKLRREGRGVYVAAVTERPWHTPEPHALWVEDTETGDGRIFAANAIYWEGDSWPLQYAEQMLHGHDGAELAGNITHVAREGNRGAGAGVLYSDLGPGAAVVSLLEREAPLGVSVDLDDVSFEIVDRRPPEDPEGPDEVVLSASAAAVTVTPAGEGRWLVAATGLTDITAAADCDCPDRSGVLAALELDAAPANLGDLLAAAGLDGATGITAAAGDPDTPDGTVVVTENAGDVLFRITRGRFRGATNVTLPAYSIARIVLGPTVAAAASDPAPELAPDPEAGAELPDGAIRDERTLAAAALLAATGHTGAMLALIPADPAAVAVPGGDDPADLHVTLANLGTAAELSDRAIQVARDTAAGVAYYHPPMEARVAGIGTLGADTPPATVLLLNGEELDQARASVWEGLGELGWEAYTTQHQPWIAHLTQGYGLDPAEITPPPTIRFDRVRLALGDQVMDWPLTGPDTPAQDVDVYAGAAAGQLEDGLTEVEASAWHELSTLPPLPAGWFAEPTETELPTDGGPVHYAAGRIWGWVAQRGVPHESLKIEAPIDNVDLTTFLRRPLQLDDGSTVNAGAFTMNVGHHRDGAECETAQCAFDDTRTVAGIVTVGTNDRGMWFAGAAAPWLSEWDRQVFATCAPSGHWRQDRRGRWSLRAVLAVPFPGYPTRLAASAVIERANLALTPGPAHTAQVSTQVATEVTEVVEAELGDLDWTAMAAAVVDEFERRQAARAELAALTAEIDQAAGDPLTPATT